jgi:hypothetical protein
MYSTNRASLRIARALFSARRRELALARLAALGLRFRDCVRALTVQPVRAPIAIRVRVR